MSRSSIRLGGIAVFGAVAVGALFSPALATGTTAAMPAPEDTPAASAVASLTLTQSPAVPTGAVTHKAVKTALVKQPDGLLLSHLTIPNISATASSTGYAARDLLLDAAPDLSDRDLAFELQRQEGEAWTGVYSGTTTGSSDTATVPNLPAGTYRVSIPAQFGLEAYVGQPFVHAPRMLSASLAFSAGDARTNVDVNPDPAAATAYQFTLEKKDGNGWTAVGTYATTDAAGGYAFSDLASGTYRVTVPDQADAIGAASNEVSVKSLADQRAEAQRAEAERAASERAAAARSATRSSSSGSRGSSPAPVYNNAPSSANTGGIVGTALAQVGDTYRLGGNGPDVFDCSGLTSYAYRAAGISIPRTASAQYASAQKVSNPQPGDLVFFLNGAQHVGIYLGNGMMVHAANPSRGVEVTSIGSGWYASTFTGYGRY